MEGSYENDFHSADVPFEKLTAYFFWQVNCFEIILELSGPEQEGHLAL